jgi:EAL domain-containing protein (putative c-di-GMP-specific phosphodiesterase class I)
MAQHPYLYLKLLLKSRLSLDIDEYGLFDSKQQGVVCHFLGMRLASAFQPIVRADGKAVGREALLRAGYFSDDAIKPDVAFDDAVKANRIVQFDRLVRTIHLLNHARSFTEHELLFLNVHPRLLTSVNDHGRTFEQVLHYYSVPTSQVVIEIQESAVKDDARLEDAVKNYRSLGYQIAIDNFGAGHGSLDKLFHPRPSHNRLNSIEGLGWFNRVLNLRPDFVKLDSAVLHQAEKDPQALLVLHRLIDLFHGIGARVVAQNIETEAQLKLVRSAGADLFQGHHLGCPTSVQPVISALLDGQPLAA